MSGSTITTAQYLDAQAKAMSEDHLLRTVKAMATRLGWRTMHQLHSIGTEPGWPDLVMVRDERLVIRELKSMKGRLTPAQLGWLAALTDAGVDVGVWRPADLLNGTILRQLSGS